MRVDRGHLGRAVAAIRRRDPPALTLLGLSTALASSLWAFAHLVEDYLTGDPIVRWDTRFAVWLHERTSDPLVGFFKVVTLAGNSTVLAVLVLATAFVLIRRGRAADAVVLTLALAGAGILNALLKLVFHRARPELTFVHLETYSFPSGHAAVSASVFATLAFLLVRRTPRPVARITVSLAALAMIALICFSRLYLGAHYLSDVLTGASFGIVWATTCLIAYTLYARRNVLRGPR